MKERASAVSAALVFGSLWGLAEATAGHALHALRVPGLAGFLMFPLGFFLMSLAAARAGRPYAAILTSAVAASVKLVDLLIPGVDVMAVLNPAQAILLQGLAAASLLSVFGAETTRRLGSLFSGTTEAVSPSGTPSADLRRTPARHSGGNAFPAEELATNPNGARHETKVRPAVLLAAAVAAACAWRAAHLALGLFWAALLRAPNILQAGSATLLRFLILGGLANGVFIFFLLKARPSLLPSSSAPHELLRFRLHPAAALALLVAAVVAEIAL